MAAPKLSIPEWISTYRGVHGSIAAMSRATGQPERTLHLRRARLERDGLLTPLVGGPGVETKWAYPKQRNYNFESGVVIVYSDAHYWPSEPPTVAFRALLKLCDALRPTVVIANGDLIDGAKISRFPSAGWAKLPSMKEELDYMQARQAEVVKAAPKAKLFRTVGNHDLRLDRFFATSADQFEGLPGTRLADFLPDWPESYSVRINDTFVKHRFRGGTHAGWNNVLNAGASIVTGHLHKLECKPIRGYRDARMWGVETGTISEHPADVPEEGSGPFEYGEDNPVNWACGFAVLTYYKGRLLPPEFCSVEFGKAWFRSQVVA